MLLTTSRAWGSAITLVLLLAHGSDGAEPITISLKNSFIKANKDRATIDATYTVDKAHAKANSPSKDGDLHVAGRAPEIGLAAVAEIMNAKFARDAVDAVHAAETSHASIKLTGVWRLWAEHAGTSAQTQGAPLLPFDTTNPDHVFEMHPLTRVGDIDVRDTFKEIIGYTYKDAEQAFVTYENVRSTIIPGATSTTIKTSMAGFNYVAFRIEPNEKATKRPDGYTVLSSVRAEDGHLLVRRRRMVFVEGTAPYKRLDDLVTAHPEGFPADQCMHVLGVPRISLELVWWRINKGPRESLSWDLPYEMVVVGLLDASTSCDEE